VKRGAGSRLLPRPLGEGWGEGLNGRACRNCIACVGASERRTTMLDNTAGKCYTACHRAGWLSGVDRMEDAREAHPSAGAGEGDGGRQSALVDTSIDVFVVKLNPTGSELIYSTYLGGGKKDVGSGIAVDAAGHAYVTGSTDSPNFPTTSRVFQTVLSGSYNHLDAFVAKLNLMGSALIYSTYLGGNNSDESFGIAVDASGAMTWMSVRGRSSNATNRSRSLRGLCSPCT
jgi:hypothetical protein